MSTTKNLGEDYLRAKKILLRRRSITKSAINLDDKEDAFNKKMALISKGELPVPMLFDPFKDKISS